MPGIFWLMIALMMVGAIASGMLARERRRIRAAGITAARPGCPQCLYPLGGWSSSHCPECGCDVACGAVRTGPRQPPLLLTLIFLLAWLILTFIAVRGGATWLLASTHDTGVWQYAPIDGQPLYRVTIERDVFWRRFPPADTLTMRIGVHRASSQTLVRRDQPIPPPVRGWVLKTSDAPPPESDLVEAFRQAAPEAADPLAGARARRLLESIAGLQQAPPVMLTGWNVQTDLWASGGYSTHAAQGGDAGLFVAAMLVGPIAWFAARALVRRRSPAQRQVIDGEWARPSP